MRIVGIILVLCGVAAMFFGGIPYNKTETSGQVGTMKLSVSQRKVYPVHPVAAGVIVGLGVVLLFTNPRRKA